MVSGLTNLTSTTTTINKNFNNYYTVTQSTNLLFLKANQVDLISGFSNLTSTTSSISNNFNN